jgi:hypothetical protein
VTLALGVVGRGSRPVEFQLDLPGSAIHFSADGTPVSWTPLPELPIGFMTPDAEGLGGVRQRATVAPGVLGAISLPVLVPDGADQLSAQLVGNWFLPGHQTPEEFEARTAPQTL